MSKSEIIQGTIGVIGVIALVVLLVAFIPLVFIWAVNTLFTLSIKYTVMNWFAAAVIIFCLNGGRK